MRVATLSAKPKLVVLLEVFCKVVEGFNCVLLNFFMEGLYNIKGDIIKFSLRENVKRVEITLPCESLWIF